jgi:tetratricopeptide (TPR) repeat protein
MPMPGSFARFAAAALVGFAVGFGLLSGPAQAQTPDPRDTFDVAEFPYCCPRPGWWDEVEMDSRIGSIGDFEAIWRNDALSDRQKAKAMFRAIEDFVHRDNDITAAAINYYYWVDRKYPAIRRLYEFGAARFLDYDRPLDRYGGKVGDMSAGMVNNLARIYMREDAPEQAVPWLRYILDQREAEVNDHLLETAAVHLGDALNRLDRGPEAIEVLLAAREKYDGDWERSIDEQLTKVRERMGLSYFRHDTRWIAPVAVIAVLLAGAFQFYRRRRWRRH